ncbi:hypothetical protein DIM_11830 [Candidatus Denitrolinea symbiosum]|nr:hypothetical protein [Chloroflexi bacterium CFX2]GER79102.1 hypothetical protein DIM_11830 [Candidatus Denitrolinea symbiosum]HPO85054.1 hypothetical protein [Candidatus Hydrogenedentota bacterium]
MASHRKSKRPKPSGALSNKVLSWFAGQTATFGMLTLIGALSFAVIVARRYSGFLIDIGSVDQGTYPSVIATSDPTVTSCPAEAPIMAPSPAPGRGLYILIDRSISYKQDTQWALDTIKHVLGETLSADDRLTASWIGQDSADPNNTFCCEQPVPQIEAPSLPPIPVRPVLEQTLSPNHEASSVEEAQRELNNKFIVARNKEKTQKYNCDMKKRNEDASWKLQSWHSDELSAINAFWQSAEPKFSITRFESFTNIREAIYRAATVLNGDDKRQVRYLILFSDMNETYARGFTGVHPYLSNVTVIVVLRCAQATKCEELKSHWTEEFAQMNAKEIIYIQETYPEEKLIDLLARR